MNKPFGDDMTILKLGSRYLSTVCDTQVMVIRTSPDAHDLRCGGHPMMLAGGPAQRSGAPEPDFASGTLIGKRYIDEADRVELLCTKPGTGSLSLGAQQLLVKQAKALPSSD
jgi:hypothetical protein